MRIRNFAHKGLQKLYAEDSAKGVPADTDMAESEICDVNLENYH